MINLMDVATEEISFNIPKIKLTNEEEFIRIKESIKCLQEEKFNLKKELKELNDTFGQIQNKM